MSNNQNDRDDLENEDLDTEQQEQEQDNGDEEHVKLPKSDYQRMRQTIQKNNKENERRRLQAKQLEEQVNAYRELGDLDDLRERLAAFEDRGHDSDDQQQQQKDMISKSEYEKSRKQLLAQIDALKSEKEDAVKTERQKFQTTLVEREAAVALAKHGGKTRFLLPEVSKSIQVQDNDGRYDFRVVDEDGELQFNDRGEPMSIEEYVLKMREQDDYAFLFEAPQRQGSGIRNQSGDKSGKSNAPRNKKRSEMSRKEKEAYIAKYTYPEYKKLPY